MSGKPLEQSFLYRTFKNVTSGTLAGVAVCLVGHPFDTLKVRLQTQSFQRPLYSGVVDCFVKTLKWEGVGGLYKGVGSPLVGQMFFRAILYSSYYQITSIMAGPERQGQRLRREEYFLAGTGAGFVASLAESPIDLFKTKMQIQIMKSKTGGEVQYRNVFHAGYLIGRDYGIRGVYQGLPATWVRNIPAFGIFLGTHEWVRDACTPEGKTVNELPVYAMFLSGGVAGFFYWFLSYPTDVIKSSMQSDDLDPTKRKYKSYTDCAKQLYREGGPKRFYRGFIPCLMRSVPANSTQLFVLELCRMYFP